MGHKHVIKGIQARATRTFASVHYLTAIKGTHAQAWRRTPIDKRNKRGTWTILNAHANWQDHGQPANDLNADS